MKIPVDVFADMEIETERKLLYEHVLFYNVLPSFYSLRLLVNHKTEKTYQDETSFKLGALTFGPALTLYTEWFVKQARKQKIHYIHPLMREGVLFQKILEQSIKQSWIRFNPCKTYVSVPTGIIFAFLFKGYVRRKLKKAGISIKDLFYSLVVESHLDPFEAYQDVFVEDLVKEEYVKDITGICRHLFVDTKCDILGETIQK